ncbi:MAG TPA: ribonuclease PH, partial [Sorangium sp.]|nr:ribonuclease PH [Sorangium sp.]
GRSLRSAVNLKALGPRTMTIDCDVLEADGGTRTASVTGGYLAAALALHNMGLARVLRDQVAAISVGFVNDKVLVDLDYEEDSSARVDLNVVATADGRLVEVQGTAEGVAIARSDFNAMLDAATVAIQALCTRQRAALTEAGANLDILMRKKDA